MDREALFALLLQELKQIQEILYAPDSRGNVGAEKMSNERLRSMQDQERFIILTMERMVSGAPPPPESAPKSAWDKLRDPV